MLGDKYAPNQYQFLDISVLHNSSMQTGGKNICSYAEKIQHKIPNALQHKLCMKLQIELICLNLMKLEGFRL